jgi:hypothetical protein
MPSYISDFISVADFELVTHYLRRTVVFEELKSIKALYVFCSGTMPSVVNQEQLKFFFTSLVSLTRKAESAAVGKYQLTVDRMFDSAVIVTLNESLEINVESIFHQNKRRISELAEHIRKLNYKPMRFNFLPFYSDEDKSRAWHLAHFCLFMVAIDHNTHSDEVRYESSAEGAFYHGSDLLYHLAQKAKKNDERLFTPRFMREVDETDVSRIFRTQEGVEPTDIAGRTAIFRTTAAELIESYQGNFLTLLSLCKNKIGGEEGFIRRIGTLNAYSDPVAKKTNLLCKLLLREGLFNAVDRGEMDIAVDHVVMTMALRSGAIECKDARVLHQLQNGIKVDEYTLSKLRNFTKTVYRLVSKDAEFFPDEVDDLIWSYGRKALREPTPLPSVHIVTSELDSQIDAQAKGNFIGFMNGIDPGGCADWSSIQTVKVPFTRFF